MKTVLQSLITASVMTTIALPLSGQFSSAFAMNEPAASNQANNYSKLFDVSASQRVSCTPCNSSCR